MHWIKSEGGPLLLLPEGALTNWGGCLSAGSVFCLESESGMESEATSDYDRACTVNGHLGLIDVCGEQGVVLNDEPLETTWIPSSNNRGGAIIRWVFAERDDVLLDIVYEISALEFHPEILLQVQSPDMMLFDAALAGYKLSEKPAEVLSIRLHPSPYQISTSMYNPNSHTSFVIHRFEPLPSSCQ